ncbi:pantoate--beta-alanine ligase [Bacillaceae bacterium SIJ1]|uniref:pantoate--beta-alanine ligase n=1 Tax=Litoribacterium kuwaitense TaxID=1398745 RepID=UPI0013ED2E17|nr:pantoate--beta-alanine ligase [Litoribacterium kuwaitense]NGP43737.1 pantoate--beta-alanine ligase [Litoribacterium kuwaitense]
MKQITSLNEMVAFVHDTKLKQKSIGFVPTMGYLHEGHRALIKDARKENDIVVLSIFVNPTQFGPNEDFAKYPRDMKRDRDIATAEQVDILFTPTVQEMYPVQPLRVSLQAGKAARELCGASRPGHFDGVLTVLLKLFMLIQPARAYFGMKDAQQVAVVEGMVHEYFLPVTIRKVATVREEDGLARSSRNVRLTSEERKEAPVLYESLQFVRQYYDAHPHLTVDVLEAEWLRFLEEKLRFGSIDYARILSFPELQKPTFKGPQLAALAVRYSAARLIDNLLWEEE